LIDIVISLSSYSPDCEDFSEIANYVLGSEGFKIQSLSIVVCGHERISELNKTYLDRDYVTDVLAFDLRTNPDLLEVDGEIYLDAETAEDRSPEFSTSPEVELRRYLIHGLLHLMNYTDNDDKGKDEMRKKEDFYLDKLGLR